jgi:hypothetical protein
MHVDFGSLHLTAASTAATNIACSSSVLHSPKLATGTADGALQQPISFSCLIFGSITKLNFANTEHRFPSLTFGYPKYLEVNDIC